MAINAVRSGMFGRFGVAFGSERPDIQNKQAFADEVNASHIASMLSAMGKRGAEMFGEGGQPSPGRSGGQFAGAGRGGFGEVGRGG